MKKIVLFLLTLTVLIAACGGGDTPASEPTLEPAPVSQTESSPQPTELVEVKFEPQAGDTRTYIDGTTIVYIPAGEFIMGVKDGVDNPEHLVYTDGFWVYSTEVAKAQYDLCVATGACTPSIPSNTLFPDDPLLSAHPITNVTHQQAEAYCQWVNGRLPSEAEWEKAARAPEWKDYPWSDEKPTCDRTNFGECETLSTEPVTAYPSGQTPHRIFDMAGNAYEWISDWYADDYYPVSPFENPAGPAKGEERVIRGGSYLSRAEEITTFARSQYSPEESRNDLGFRCVIEMQDVEDFAPMCIQLSTVEGETQQPTVDCPKVSVSTNSFCENGIPYISHSNYTDPGYTILTPNIGKVSGMDNAEFNKMWQNCKFIKTEKNGYMRVCQGPEGASFEIATNAQCMIIDVENVCGENYEYDPNQQACVYNSKNIDEGKHTECPSGFEFDANIQCCSTTQALTIPLACQPGFVYDPNTQKCISVQGWVNTQSKYALATFPFCTITDKPKEEPEEPTCDPATGAGCPTNSDIRLKTDIVLIGKAENGLPLYTFRYIGGTTVYQGVMAQDVLKFMPEAVVVMPNGYMAVYYELLGLTMERVR
jgi:formylglycine-generating enzyme